MNYYPSNFSRTLQIGGIFLTCLFITSFSADAQCINRSSLSVPMWEIYGINPMRPRVEPSIRFTPLQQSPQIACAPCATSPTSAGEVYLGVVTASEPPADAIIESVAGERPSNTVVVEPANPGVAEAETEVGSIPSPSDIVLVQPKEKVPTLADESTQDSSSDLDDARAEIERLKTQLANANEKSRTAVERAYAAEKAAAAATENAESKLQKLQLNSLDQEKMNLDAQKELEAHQIRISEMAKQLDKAKAELVSEKDRQMQQRALLEKAIMQAEIQAKHAAEQAKLAEEQTVIASAMAEEAKVAAAEITEAKPQQRVGDARKLVEQLEADASAVKSESETKNRQRKAEMDKKTRLADEKANRATIKPAKKPDDSQPANNNKRPRQKFNAQEQIKKLNESMDRQIKKSATQINKRNQAQIDKLIDSGKEESDPEVKAAKAKLEEELKANESKIRKRIEERIQRIRKEAAARAKS